MNNAAEDLEGVARVCRVLSATEFEIDGIRHEARRSQGDELDLTSDLADAIYTIYCRTSRHQSRRPHDFLASRRFIERLSVANTGTGTWDPGWQVVMRDDDGRHAVKKNELTLWVHEHAMRPESEKPEPGALVRIRVPKEMRAFQPGFYLAVGDEPRSARPPHVVTRLYWHLTADVAERAVALFTRKLNELKIPFSFKVLAEPQAFTRADSGVLYIDRVDCLQIRDTLLDLHWTLAPNLGRDAPRFVKRLGTGFGVAEGPVNGASFGQHRCCLMAKGLVAAWRAGSNKAPQRVDAVRIAFLNAGLCPDRPYLAPESLDNYNFLEASS